MRLRTGQRKGWVQRKERDRGEKGEKEGGGAREGEREKDGGIWRAEQLKHRMKRQQASNPSAQQHLAWARMKRLEGDLARNRESQRCLGRAGS